MRQRLLVIICFVSLVSISRAQNQVLIDFSYGVNIPIADLKKRFGNGFTLKNSSTLMFKNNWIVGMSGSFIFGNKVKEDVLTPLRNSQGLIIGNDKQIAEIFLRERAFSSILIIGKWFSKETYKFDRGWEITSGLGFLQHKIRIVDNFMSGVQLFGDYKKGYDRLSNGIAIPLSISYRWLANDGRLNVFIQSETLYSPAKERRDIQYDTQNIPSERRTDIFQSFTVGITLPFSIGSDSEKKYY